MYILLSCAVSVDGYLDDTSDQRLLLSNAEDFDRVDEERAGCDAILVGANTVRSDRPRLRIRSAERQAARLARGLPAHPLRAVISGSGNVEVEDDWLVYPSIEAALKDLAARGVNRLMVEGGANLLAQFTAAGLADELQLAVAPLLVGDPGAPRFHGTGELTLAEVRQLGQVVVLRYLLKDHVHLRRAIELSRLCPPSDTAFSVGAVIVRDGEVLAEGYSRETDDKVHAEESALAKLADARGATVYSSLEPCSIRKSRPAPCAQLLIDAGVARVVFAWREPPIFVDGDGATVLRQAGIEVVEVPALAAEARAVNARMGE